MNIKDYLIASGLSLLIGLVIMIFTILLSAISWIAIWMISTLILIPVFMKIIKFYKDTDCNDLSDFFIEVEDYFKEKVNKINSIESDDDNKIL